MALFKIAHEKYTNANKKHGRWRAADFNSAQALVKKAEGGYGNDARDPGNYTGGKIGVGTLIGTKYGISAPTLKAYLGHEPSVSEMQNLPYATALNIYRSNYWNSIGGDSINDQKLANLLYDGSVNEGPGTIKKFVSDSLGTSYSPANINAANPTKLFNEVGAKREAHYKAIGGYALGSWLKRLSDLGYAGINAVRNNIGKTIAIALVIGTFIGVGIYLIRKK